MSAIRLIQPLMFDQRKDEEGKIDGEDYAFWRKSGVHNKIVR